MSSQLHVKKRLKYKPEQMAMAIQMVKTGAMSRKLAAKTYGVPKTTLLDKLSGRVPETPTKPGKRPELTSAEERTLVNYIKLMHQIGYPLTRKELLREVKRILDIDGRPTSFKDNLPGKDWFQKFKKRHPEIALRTPMALGQERASISYDMILGWYDVLFAFLEKEIPDYRNMLKDPRRVFNADESGFPLAVKSGRVIAPTGARHVYQVVTNTKTQITVMAALNAFGEYLPPMILFPGERLRNIGLSGFPEATYSTTPNGWMDSETFVEFLKQLFTFAKQKEIKFPIILFVDGHSTHMSLPAARFCHEHDIILYCLLPNATHVLQACDIGLFSPLKSAWQAAVKTWQLDHIGEALSKTQFPEIFKETWVKVTTFENACHGFRQSGLFPLTPDGIDKTKLGPSKLLIRENTHQFASQSSKEISKENTSPNVSICVSPTSVSPTSVNAASPLQAPVCNTTSITIARSESVTSLHSPIALFEETSPSTSSTSVKDPEYVSPAFLKLKIPEPVHKKSRQVLRQKLPKAISGSVALQMLEEREKQKQEEAKAKELRKQERELKRKQKEEEKQRKKEEREQKKKLKELKMKKKRKSGETSSSESDVDVPYMDSDIDDFIYDDDLAGSCHGCHLSNGDPGDWIGCDECARWWHVKCTGQPDLQGLNHAELGDVSFKCKLC